ncbi:alpha/beta hydrolase [Streptomyces sp. SL13]|jgi:pimeloyl-ACP methyl ester carboxylesterase|uniref:Alpha/beta hydrolase n=1 Tax=Streptantibioticus silvisoli TaxID=2705255 RepID=A0AA90H7J5_9ACTN|nr:alpha/beta hydrolase [Streptantibioticus silvisoli]MDI5965397.1 alpha/beta hydrolase [Streptantibioticus silvisoli]MDI5972017.1 alpha/beta hydrolase [Streptantibioticus silvisoli]
MATYVLLPGFWLGAWAWRPVTAGLRGHGHDVHPLSLTGMGERAHLARPDTGLETHITDVLQLIHYEDLHDVVLVGHSYAGAVVLPGVADRIPERIARLVFVDSGPLPDGMSHAQFVPPQEQARNAERVRTAGDGWRLPPPSWPQVAAAVPGLPDGTLDRLTRLSVPQPWATATTPARLTGAWEKVPRLHVLCSFGAEEVRARAGSVPAFQHMAAEGWAYRELPGWHWPMFDRPAELAAILHEAA